MEKHRPEDDLFKKILEDHPDFEPSKSDFNDMRNRLDTAENSNHKNGFGFWWLPLLLLPFILISGFLFYQNQKLNHQIELLSSKILTIQDDTTTHKYVTYHFDTIYNTTYIEQTLERESLRDYQNKNSSVLNYLSTNSNPFALQTSNDFFNFNNPNSFQNPIIYGAGNTFTTLQNYNSSQGIKQTNSIPKDRFGNTIAASQNALPISPITSFLGKNRNVNVLLKNIDPTFEYKKRRKKPFHYFSPKRFKIGVTGSPYSLTKVRSSTFRPTFSYGVEGEIGFNKNVKLLIGLRKMDLTFEEKDPLVLALFPTIMANDPTDKLRELYVTLNQIQVPISLKYLFSNDRKWQSFFSVGLIANRPLQQKFRHKFISTSLEEYEVLQSFNDGTFSIKNFEGAFGVETNLTSKISGSASLYYLHDFELNLGEYFLLRNAGINLSLKYKL